MTLEVFKGDSPFQILQKSGAPPSEWPEWTKLKRNWWKLVRRPSQKMYFDRNWRIRYMPGGRGSGKTIAGCEGVVEAIDLGYRNIAVIGRSISSTRNTIVVDNLLPALDRRWGVGNYEHNKTDKFIFVPNGARIRFYSAEASEDLRGPDLDLVYADELLVWSGIGSGIDKQDPWSNIRHATRKKDHSGARPTRLIVTTNPSGIELAKELMDDPRSLANILPIYENTHNLDRGIIEDMESIRGTQKWRVEALGETPDYVEGAMWTGTEIRSARLALSLIHI